MNVQEMPREMPDGDHADKAQFVAVLCRGRDGCDAERKYRPAGGMRLRRQRAPLRMPLHGSQ